jgi:hypothetical protein
MQNLNGFQSLTTNNIHVDNTEEEEEEGMSLSFVRRAVRTVIPSVRSFIDEALIAGGRKKIRKVARSQGLIGNVVGKNGTPEKGSASAGSKEASEFICHFISKNLSY